MKYRVYNIPLLGIHSSTLYTSGFSNLASIDFSSAIAFGDTAIQVHFTQT